MIIFPFLSINAFFYCYQNFHYKNYIFVAWYRCIWTNLTCVYPVFGMNWFSSPLPFAFSFLVSLILLFFYNQSILYYVLRSLSLRVLNILGFYAITLVNFIPSTMVMIPFKDGLLPSNHITYQRESSFSGIVSSQWKS